jgi:hypothetical protein
MPYSKQEQSGQTWLSRARYGEDAPVVGESSYASTALEWVKLNWMYVVGALILVVLIVWYSRSRSKPAFRSRYY